MFVSICLSFGASAQGIIANYTSLILFFYQLGIFSVNVNGWLEILGFEFNYFLWII